MDNRKLKRLHYKTKIKRDLNKRFKRHLESFSVGIRYFIYHFTEEEIYIERRRFFKDEGKSLRYGCHCSWCTEGRFAKDRRKHQRMAYDYNYFFIREEDTRIEND